MEREAFCSGDANPVCKPDTAPEVDPMPAYVAGQVIEDIAAWLNE